jgi:hypothetical protein
MLAQVTTKHAFLACAELIGSARGERNVDYVLFIGCTYAWTRHTIAYYIVLYELEMVYTWKVHPFSS